MMPDQQANLATRIAERNMVLLGQHYEKTAADLLAARRKARAARQETLFQIHPPLKGDPTCLTAQGMLHDPSDPVAEARSVVESLAIEDSNLVLVYRSGLAYLPMILLQKATQEWPNLKILVHEDRWEAVWESLTSLDWSVLIPSASVFLCLGENADAEIVSLLKAHPSLLSGGLRVTWGTKADEEGMRGLKDLLSALENIAADAPERLANWKKQVVSGSPRRKQRESVILCGRVFEDQMRGFQAGLEQNEVSVKRVERSPSMSRFVANEISWIETCGECPDIVASFNRSGFEPVELHEMGLAGVRRIAWFYDNPQRFDLLSPDFEHFDLFIVFDPHHISCLRSKTGKRVEHLRTATSFREAPDVPRPARCRQAPAVSFVGSSGMRRLQGFAGAIQRCPDPIRNMIENRTREWYGTDPIRLHNELLSLPIQSADLPSWQLLGLIEEYASMYLRLNYLQIVKPFGLMIFGDPGWADSRIPGTIPEAYAGWAPDYWTETPWIYRNSLINLNLFHVQCLDSPTIRVYDILACGGFLLTEYRPCLEEEFSIGRDLETFRTPEELSEKVDYYLRHDSERTKVARKGQERVLKHYTYVQRGADFLRLARSLLEKQ